VGGRGGGRRGRGELEWTGNVASADQTIAVHVGLGTASANDAVKARSLWITTAVWQFAVSVVTCVAQMVGAALERERLRSLHPRLRFERSISTGRCCQHDLTLRFTLHISLHSIHSPMLPRMMFPWTVFQSTTSHDVVGRSCLMCIRHVIYMAQAPSPFLEPHVHQQHSTSSPPSARRSPTQHPVFYRPSQSPKYESRRKIGPGSKPVRPSFSASRARQGWCGQLTRHLR
jgi:hypothetical protein